MEEPAVIEIGFDEDKPQKHNSHTFAVHNFDGTSPAEIVEADQFLICVPTRACVQFWITVGACVLGAIVALVMMIVQGTGSPLFYFWEALFCLTFGILVPSPDYSNLYKKKT